MTAPTTKMQPQQWWQDFERYISFNKQTGVLTFLKPPPPPSKRQRKGLRESYILRWADGEDNLIRNMSNLKVVGDEQIKENVAVVTIWKKLLYDWLEDVWFLSHNDDPSIEDIRKGVLHNGLEWHYYEDENAKEPKPRDWSTVFKPLEQRQGRAVSKRDEKQEQRRRELSAKKDWELSEQDAAELLYFPHNTEQDHHLFSILHPWLFNGIQTKGKLEEMPELQHALTEAMQTRWWETWRVPYELKDGKPMKTVAYLSNWLVQQPNIQMPNNVRRCIIKKSNLENAGMGLFAYEDIEAGQIIAVYGGKEYDDQQDYEKERNGGKPIPKEIKEARHAYFLEGNHFVDGYRDFYLLEQGRWANDKHPDTKGNNAEYIPEEDGSFFVKATKNIRKNQEIFVDYGPKYWKKK